MTCVYPFRLARSQQQNPHELTFRLARLNAVWPWPMLSTGKRGEGRRWITTITQLRSFQCFNPLPSAGALPVYHALPCCTLYGFRQNGAPQPHTPRFPFLRPRAPVRPRPLRPRRSALPSSNEQDHLRPPTLHRPLLPRAPPPPPPPRARRQRTLVSSPQRAAPWGRAARRSLARCRRAGNGRRPVWGDTVRVRVMGLTKVRVMWG